MAVTPTAGRSSGRRSLPSEPAPNSGADVSPVRRTRFVRVVVSESKGMAMPFAYSAEFRSMIVEQMRDGRSVAGPARELEMHESTLHRWKRQDRVDRGLISGVGDRGVRSAALSPQADPGAGSRAGGREAGVGAVRGRARGTGGASKRHLRDRGGLGS